MHNYIHHRHVDINLQEEQAAGSGSANIRLCYWQMWLGVSNMLSFDCFLSFRLVDIYISDHDDQTNNAETVGVCSLYYYCKNLWNEIDYGLCSTWITLVSGNGVQWIPKILFVLFLKTFQQSARALRGGLLPHSRYLVYQSGQKWIVLHFYCN